MHNSFAESSNGSEGNESLVTLAIVRDSMVAHFPALLMEKVFANIFFGCCTTQGSLTATARANSVSVYLENLKFCWTARGEAQNPSNFFADQNRTALHSQKLQRNFLLSDTTGISHP
jgi:hypothetical protein